MSEGECKFRMRKVRSIDEIHEECVRLGADYVVSSDAPLVTALNARSEKVLFGYAYTPRKLADTLSTQLVGTTPDSDLEVSRMIMHITGHSLRFTHSTVKKIREIRRYTPEVGDYLLSRKEKEAYEAYMQTHPIDGIMGMFDADHSPFFNGRKVVTVDVGLFSSIDKRMKPTDSEDIDNADLEDYPESDYVIDRIYSIGNDRQIAECIADLITLDNCEDVAIVLDSGGSIAEAVRSALYRRGIPFKNNLSVKDLAPIRDYLRFLNAALNYNTVRCGDVRDLFTAYGASPAGLWTKIDNYLLCKITPAQYAKPDDRTTELIELLSGTYRGEHTFESVVDRLPRSNGRSSVKILLRDMGLTDEKVTREHLNDIEYAVNNIDDLKHNEQIPEDERRGVLLADCKKSVYIDRSIIFFVGLDDAWHNSPAGKDYIRDPMDFEEKEAKRMRILLQQGDTRYYIVRPATNGKETVPCLTFESISQLEGRAMHVEHFKQLCNEIVPGSWHPESPALVLPDVSRPAGALGKHVIFSKTDYNSWCDCPFKFSFNKVIKNNNEDNSASLFGNCVHDFCEFCFCYPDYAMEGFDGYVDRLLKEYSGISQTCLSEVDASRFRTMMKNAMLFITALRPAQVEMDSDNSTRKYPNLLISEDERTGNRCSSLAEEFMDSALGHSFFAKYDLRVGNDIYDWKTGKAHSIDEIMKAFSEKPKDNHEFQPLIYLQTLRERLGPDCGPISFNLVYLGNRCAEMVAEGDGRDMSRIVRTIVCEDLSDAESIRKYGVLDAVYDDVSTKSSGVYPNIVQNWDRVVAAILDYAEQPGWIDSDSTLVSLANVIGVNPVKTNLKGIKTFLNKIAPYCGDVKVFDNRLVITPAYLDDFVKRLEKDAVSADESLSLPMFKPSREKVICNYCNYLALCMSPLADDSFAEGDEE
ncbi:MAG: hypothetical protein E7Z63_03905 [Thermoplasmata archaeon]|nr:hypothetical protein [Thermoplasmata archaeon]